MGLKGIFKKLFCVEEVVSGDISTYSGLVAIPLREQLLEYEGAISLLDEIKEKYIHILSSKRLVTSKDLNFGELRQEMNMYIDLIMNLTSNSDVSSSFDNATLYNNGTRRLEYLAKIGKLKSYTNSINSLEIETILRLVALKELLEEKVYLSPLKKNSIVKELDNLSYTYINFMIQKKAITVEADRFLTEYESLKSDEFVKKKVDRKLVRARCQELRVMIKILIPEELDKYMKLGDSISSIILMEARLEEYIYKNKEEVIDFKEKLKDLTRFIKDYLELGEISTYIFDLEIMLKAFALFSCKLISDEDIFNLYSLKFACLTKDFMREEINLVDGASYVELECYQQIILNKISDILTGKNAIFNRIFDADKVSAIKMFSNIMKGNDKEYLFWEILKSKQVFGLLVAFDKIDGLKEYFSSIIVEKDSYSSLDFHERIFEFERTFPLDTAFCMIYYNKGDSFSPLYGLFKIMKEQDDNVFFTLPEGLLRVNIPEDVNKLSESDRKFIERIREIANYSTMETPSTLKELNGNLFGNVHFIDITLNNGLRKVGKDVFDSISAESIYIPASLEDIDASALEDASVDEFYFEDYSKSSLSLDSKANLIRNFFVSNRTNRRRCIILSDDIIRKQLEFATGVCIDKDDPELQGKICFTVDFNISPTFSKLILCEDNIPVVSIEGRDLGFSSKRVITAPSYNSRITDYEVDVILKRADKIVKSISDVESVKKKVKDIS